MHRSRFAGIIIDCRTDDPDSAAAFWSAALGYPRSESQEDPGYVSLDAPAGETYVEIQAVDHDSRVHLDIETDDVDAEVSRLTALGAREIRRVKGWAVLEAPTGQRFCVVPVANGHFETTANHWD
jgi:predicted enzyme related to lactoylglutathione lyase